jgi:hypothetical protein
MLKPIAVNAEQFGSAQPKTDESIVNNVFKVFHGFYGSLFLGKFASGVTDSAGRDKGVASARTVWAFSLRKFSEQTVVAALEPCTLSSRRACRSFWPCAPRALRARCSGSTTPSA